jgi:membrane-associated phospholipid phosphatase
VDRVRRSLLSLAVAAAAAGLALLTWWVAFRTGVGHRADVSLLERAAFGYRSVAARLAETVATLCNTGPYAALVLVVVAAAVSAYGARGGVVVGALLVIPNAVTQALKVATSEDRVRGPHTFLVHVQPESWPSGHATAALALVAGAVVVVPPARRRLMAGVGALFALAVGVAVTGLGWHFPSDVLGGYLIATTGAALALPFLPARLPERLVGPVRGPREDEQQVAQPVEVADRLGADRVPAGDGPAFGAPAHGAAHVQLGAGRRPAR